MHRLVTRCVGVAAVALALLAPVGAFAKGDVVVSLTAHRIVQKNGQETVAAADKAKPGDVVEYRAVTRNAGATPVKQVAATIPIPVGMEYLPGTASPAPVMASLDGATFEPVPLKRRVRLADGREVEREVPAAEYRWLRWSIAALDARAERTVRARVRVAPLEVAASAR
jgi:uncharacterized repeat protein (TIGR01451 family)